MKSTLLIFASISLAACASVAGPARATPKTEEHRLLPFTTDDCSEFPDGTFGDPDQWRHCCVAHDVQYWQGGTRADRSKADQELADCVGATGAEFVGLLMGLGVRVGGTPILPLTWHWGYGWNYMRPYGPLTEDEKKQVQLLAPADPYSVPLTNPGVFIPQSE